MKLGTKFGLTAVAVTGLCGAGLVAAAAGASAAGAPLSLTAPAVVTTLDLAGGGSIRANGTFFSQPVADATYAVQVLSPIRGDLTMSVDAYSPPTGVSPIGAQMFFAQGKVNDVHAPNAIGSWHAAVVGAPGVRVTRAHRTVKDSQYLTANKPGTWTVTFRDDQGTAGTDDDATATVKVRVLDVGYTPEVLIDDWTPALTMPALAAKRDAIPAAVALGTVDGLDARSSTGGVGILRSAISHLVGLRFDGSVNSGSAGTWLADDLKVDNTCASVTDLTDLRSGCTLRDMVNPAGSRGVLANSTRHAPGTVTGYAYFGGVNSSVVAPAVAGNPGMVQTQGLFPLGSAKTDVVPAIAGHIALATSTTACTGACWVTVNGSTPDTGKLVTVNANGRQVATVAANPVTGDFSARFLIRTSTTFTASSQSAVSAGVRVTVKSVVLALGVEAKGHQRVQITLYGGPLGHGVVQVFRDGRYQFSTTASASGRWQGVLAHQPRGRHTYQVTYTAPGTVTSAPVARRIVVK